MLFGFQCALLPLYSTFIVVCVHLGLLTFCLPEIPGVSGDRSFVFLLGTDWNSALAHLVAGPAPSSGHCPAAAALHSSAGVWRSRPMFLTPKENQACLESSFWVF